MFCQPHKSSSKCVNFLGTLCDVSRCWALYAFYNNFDCCQKFLDRRRPHFAGWLSEGKVTERQTPKQKQNQKPPQKWTTICLHCLPSQPLWYPGLRESTHFYRVYAFITLIVVGDMIWKLGSSSLYIFFCCYFSICLLAIVIYLSHRLKVFPKLLFAGFKKPSSQLTQSRTPSWMQVFRLALLQPGVCDFGR